MEKKKVAFATRHPKINFLFGLILLVALLLGALWVIKLIVIFIGNGINIISAFLKNFVDTTDKVIVVAMITGAVSIVISSIVAKIIDYRYNVKKYLYDKREKPYEQFISMIYTIMEDTKKSQKERMTEDEMIKMVSEFSKGLTLWGSNGVVRKWLKYRKNSIQGGGTDSLLILEDILYEMRRDVGLKKRMKKGDMLSFFINDIDTLIKKSN